MPDDQLDNLVRNLNLLVTDLEYGDIDAEGAVSILKKITDELE